MARYDNQSVLEYFSFPVHFCFFFFVFMLLLGLSWYINYESAFESMMIKVKIFLGLVPLLLLLLVHCLSSGSPSSSLLQLLPSERNSLHRAGGSPWGVAVLLLLVLFLIPYQSSIHKRWFPLDSRNH